MEDTPDKDSTPPSTAPAASADSPSEKIEVKTNFSPASSAEEPSAAPAPRPVVSSETPASSPPPPAPVVGHHGGGKKKWLKIFIIILLIAAIAGAGYYFYNKNKTDSKAPATNQGSTIPLLKIGVLSPDYGELYPNMTPSAYATMVHSQMFEGLVRYENKSKIVPDLATTWSNPDDKTWLFTVAPNVKFHDGNTMTPKDVKYSLDTVIAADSDLAQLYTDTIASVTLVGSNQVKITTKEPDPVLLNKLAFLYIIDANLPKGDEPSMAGTGPYYVKPDSKPTEAAIKMVAFDDYHGGAPKVQALDFGSSDDPKTLVKDFKSSKYNIIGPIPKDDAAGVKGAFTYTSVESGVDYIGFNTMKAGPLQNKLVREAVRYAINAQAIGDATGNPTTPISQVIPQSIPGYNPAITTYKQNIDKAKQLLTQAGYPNGVTIKLSTADTSEGTTQLVNNLKAAGITVTLDKHTDFDEFIDFFTGGKADMYKVNYSSDTYDGLDIVTTSIDKANYTNAKLDALTAEIATTTDPAKRLKLLQQAEALIDQDVAVVPMYTQNEVWLMDKNYNLKQDTPSSLISVYFYKVQVK